MRHRAPLTIAFLLAVGCGKADGVTGAGWSFGLCGSHCYGDLEIDGADLQFTIRGQLPAREVQHESSGTLTTAGRQQLDSLSDELLGADLEERYGCPDCADGGAAYIALVGGDATTSHTYEFSKPPTDLAEIDAFLGDVQEALDTCVSNEQVEVEAGCVPRH